MTTRSASRLREIRHARIERLEKLVTESASQRDRNRYEREAYRMWERVLDARDLESIASRLSDVARSALAQPEDLQE